jgi:hypothetical protein
MNAVASDRWRILGWTMVAFEAQDRDFATK